MGLLAAFALALHLALPDAGRTRDLAWTIQTSVAALAIAVGGVFAGYKWQVFRDFAPHLTVSHVISHRFIGHSYVHIDATANLYNSSKVQIEIRNGFSRLQHIAPASDEEVEQLYAQVFLDRDHDYLQWPTGDDVLRTWDKNQFIIEPGETHTEIFEFIVSKEFKSALVYTYFYNARSAEPQGWGVATVYDIVDVAAL